MSNRKKIKTNKAKSTPKNVNKIKVLAYCDAPTCATGFGTVSRNIFEALYKTGRYDIDILGINYWGDPHNFPYRIWPTGTNSEKDPYGRQKVVNMIPQMDFDLLFFLQDTFIMNFLPTLVPHLKSNREKPFKSICYYPIDSILKPEWGKNIDVVDTLVAYCEFGKQETLKTLPDRKDIAVINHGVNVNDYYPLSDNEIKAFREQYFGNQASKFIITNLNRNQQRKDIPRTLMAFKKFREIVPDSILYLHMSMKDQGWDLPEVCKGMGFDISKDVIFPQNFGPNQGYPKHIVNALYNISDVVISTTTGEGWGLCLHPETNIYTLNGIKSMKKLTIDDKVLSSDGTYNNIEGIMSRDYRGDLYKITTWLSNIPIRPSPEHGFRVYKNDSYVWRKAAELEIGDVLLFPKKYQRADSKLNILELIKPYLNIRQLKNIIKDNDKFKIQSNFKKNEHLIPKEIKITPSLMRLFGLYLAEGSVSRSKMDGIIFSFHKKETELLEFVEKEMKKVFDLDKFDQSADKSRGDQYNGKSIKFYSSVVAFLFYTLFGSGARNKKIHSILLNQNLEYLKELLYGEFLGDGYYSNSLNEFQFSTTSKDIAYSVRLLLARLGILSSVRTSRVEYKIDVSGISKENLLKMFGLPYPDLDRSKANEKCFQNDEYLMLPIKSIEKVYYNGKLIDIQVKNINDFVAENVIVHNSWIEAMAAKTSVIMPDNTSMSEIITEDKGYLVKSGSNASLFSILPHDNEVLRPLVDVDDLVDKLVYVYNNREEAAQKAENAYKWVVEDMNWQKGIAKQWVKVFDESYKKIGEDQKESHQEIESSIDKIIKTEEI